MARKTKPLTDTEIKNAKPRDKAYKLFDGGGLHLLVNKSGAKYWRWNYKLHGKNKTLSMGVYPDVTLKRARAGRKEAADSILDGIDPSDRRKLEKANLTKDSFEAVAREWHSKQKQTWAPKTSKETLRRMERDLFPWLGAVPTNSITAPQLLAALRRVEARGALDLASDIRALAGRIFRYAVATGRAERDPAADLKGAIATHKVKHFASIIDPESIGGLLRAIDGYKGDSATCFALRLAPLVFVRPGELRHAEWSEINLDKAEWKIPAEKMKMRERHIIPLSHQAVDILRELLQLTGPSGYLFPSIRSKSYPISDNTINAALRRMGYTKEQMTGHGFRSMASTTLHEQGWSTDVIERQLAHAERNKIKGAYNYAEHLVERRRMMQHWSDYLQGLKTGADVVPINQTG